MAHIKIFVCTNGKCMEAAVSQAVVTRIEAWIHAQGADDWDADPHIGCLPCGCLDVCQQGSVMRIFPDAVTYWRITPENVASILDQHFLQHRVVTDHLALPKNQPSHAA